MDIYRGEYQGVPLGKYLLVNNSNNQRTIKQITLELTSMFNNQLIPIKHKQFPQAVEPRDISLFLRELDQYWSTAKQLHYVFEVKDELGFQPRIAVKGASRLTSLHLAPVPEDEGEMRES